MISFHIFFKRGTLGTQLAMLRGVNLFSGCLPYVRTLVYVRFLCFISIKIDDRTFMVSLIRYVSTQATAQKFQDFMVHFIGRFVGKTISSRHFDMLQLLCRVTLLGLEHSFCQKYELLCLHRLLGGLSSCGIEGRIATFLFYKFQLVQ